MSFKLKYKPEDMMGCLIQILLHEGESGHCPLLPPARIIRVIPSKYPSTPYFIVEFVRPVTVTTPGDKEEMRFEGLTHALIEGHSEDDKLEKLLDKKPFSRFHITFCLDVWRLKKGINPSEVSTLRRGIEFEEWALGSGTAQLYEAGKRWRWKWSPYVSRWAEKLDKIIPEKI